MNGEALAALELPAITGRLAAASATELGAERAGALLPATETAEVVARQALTAEAVALLDAAQEPSLAGIADVREAAARADREGILGPGELRAIATAIRVGLAARRVAGEQRALAPLLHDRLASIDPSLAPVADEIDRCIEEDGSDVRDTASPELRRLRRELRNGGARVREELARVARASDVQEALQEQFLAERGGRPVLAVRASSRSKVPGIVHDASSTGQTLFVEPFAVVELNNRLAEAAAEAREEAERILRELSSAVTAHAEALVVLVETTADVDVVLASGALSRAWGGAPVTVSDDVRLLGARHPLLDRATAVPIDLDVGSLRAVVISGPNTGGKTVALKTLGLAALLHQCGLRPPAESASLPVFDRVLADIGDRQSIEMSLSTFSGHLRTLVEILESATERSLVLLDEVAAGTDPEEGSALAQALVGRLAQQARLTVVTTHYPELKEWASANDDVANAATSFDPDTGEPLYRIDLGRPGTSHALRIAERLGLDADVVADARSRVAPERLRTAELLAEAQAAERAAVELREKVGEALARAHERERELEREVTAVRASADRAREDAIAEAQRELASARVELSALRDELRAARRVRRESDQDRALGAATERASRVERALGDLSGPLPVTAPLAEGDPVESDVGVRGTIASIRGDEAEVVGATGQRVRIALAQLRPSRERAPEDRAPVVQVRAAAHGDASDQLDVRGLPGQEAREQVRRLVDDAALAGLDSVRVVHGRGTGALRKAVREELSSHPLVERRESDGEDGATIA
ncbi:MAG: mismatch repair protein MutS, partial [Actinomycetia bacterium]|nr:mismatch repair protein MutS [Actinomycetes bacterium]